MSDPDPITLAAAADLHGHLPEVPPADLLLLAGDLAPYEIERDPDAVADWFTSTVGPWLAAAPVPAAVAIPGNHDYWAEALDPGVHAELFGVVGLTLLIDAPLSTAGLSIFGTPWTRDDYGSAFEAPVEELARRWAAIPVGLDVLLAHCPPHGRGDEIDEGGGLEHMGTHEMAAAIARTRPRLVVWGHAHQAHGYRGEDPPGTALANVTVRTDYTGGLGAATRLELRPDA